MHDIPRNLRGAALAKEVHTLNGHQNELKFLAFHPIWFACLMTGSLTAVFPFLSFLLYIAGIGIIVEFSVWLMYFVKTRNISAYPGILTWLDIKKRRLVMNNSRLASRLGYPSDF